MNTSTLARSASVVMAGFVLSNLTGLARQILISQAFGTSAALDAFYAAQRLPDILFNLVAGGALASAFVPSFTGLLTQGQTGPAWRLASQTLNLMTAVLLVASALAWLLAEPLVAGLLAPGFANDPTQLALSVRLLRILLVAPVIFGASGLLMGVLNAHNIFLYTALAPSFYWLGMIVGVLAFAPLWGMDGLAWGAVLGAGLHLVVQLPGLRGLPQARWHTGWGLNNPAVREVVRLMGPRLLGVGAVQLNFVVSTMLASYLQVGALTALSMAWQVFTMPQVIIAQAIAIAALPMFSAQVARGDVSAMRTSLAEATRLILFLAVPATLGLLMLGQPVVAVLFERGQFTAASTTLVATALLFYTLGLVSHSVVEIVSRAFYALKDTWTPVWVGASAMLGNAALNGVLVVAFPLVGWPDYAGLAFANTLATTLEMGVLAWLIRRHLHGLELARLWPGVWRAGVAALAMAGVLAVWLMLAHGWGVWVQTGGGLALGAATYLLAAWALRSPDLAIGLSLLRRAPR